MLHPNRHYENIFDIFFSFGIYLAEFMFLTSIVWFLTRKFNAIYIRAIWFYCEIEQKGGNFQHIHTHILNKKNLSYKVGKKEMYEKARTERCAIECALVDGIKKREWGCLFNTCSLHYKQKLSHWNVHDIFRYGNDVIWVECKLRVVFLHQVQLQKYFNFYSLSKLVLPH